ncbi:hypothetical protein Poli38472_005422 [Pythium oligandrum]|uniref:Uncharacterized protein n=1 Tax=Pythium oligandrum TaxID=41045 RepID=A0A8K1FJ66_PYTOL|nr:hypothetical protein Poli38472_005422 [Pythium oligandrum]|eukprot:TMW62804.1 hypothetical protein Poli38472_005422 [Pythium oligandrum]
MDDHSTLMASSRSPRSDDAHDDGATACPYVVLHDAATDQKVRPLSASTSLWTPSTLAIPVTYLCVGFLLSFPRAYIEFFPRTRNASDAQLSTVLVVRSLPWSIKVLFGILPDNFPIKELRFKPYILLGYALSSVFHWLLARAGESELTVVSFTMLLLGAMVGIVLADVMSDALVASRVLRKEEAYPGHTQSTVYVCRGFSEMLGYWCGAFLSNRAEWAFGLTMSEVFLLLAVLPLVTVVPCIYLLEEPHVTHVATWSQQREQLWLMLQRRATWQPLCFLALFNAFLLHNSAWGNYLSVAYRFNAFEYGAMSAISASVTLLALLLYRACIHPNSTSQPSWHHVYFITGILISLFSILNILLVFKINDAMGIPAFWFAVGDSAVISFAKGFQQLPLAIMLVSACPENQEGIAYALLSSITNLAHAFAHTISNMLLRIWPVELVDLRRGDYSGVWKLTVLTSVIALAPLFWTKTLLPRGKAEQDAMRNELSVKGARVVLALYVFGFFWVLALSVLAIVEPCNVFVGGHGCPPT